MATATPAMLPMPTVPDTAVVRAWNCEISPGSWGSARRPEITRTACPNPRTLMNPRYTVKKSPPPTSHATTSGMSAPSTGTGKKMNPATAAASGCSASLMISSMPTV